MNATADALIFAAAILVIAAALLPRKGGLDRPARGRLAIASVLASVVSIGIRLVA
jgi:hypothetical protein